MTDLEFRSAYGYYLDEGSAEMLALVNLMSLFGLHRRFAEPWSVTSPQWKSPHHLLPGAWLKQ